jgi:hypothetical protein
MVEGNLSSEENPKNKNSYYYYYRFKKSYLVPYQIFAGVCCSNCKGILARLNISTLHSRRKHLDAL